MDIILFEDFPAYLQENGLDIAGPLTWGEDGRAYIPVRSVEGLSAFEQVALLKLRRGLTAEEFAAVAIGYPRDERSDCFLTWWAVEYLDLLVKRELVSREGLLYRLTEEGRRILAESSISRLPCPPPGSASSGQGGDEYEGN